LNPSKFNTEFWESPVTWWAKIPFTNKVNKFLLKPGINPYMKIKVNKSPLKLGGWGESLKNLTQTWDIASLGYCFCWVNFVMLSKWRSSIGRFSKIWL
jgi:hypothetical protein